MAYQGRDAKTFFRTPFPFLRRIGRRHATSGEVIGLYRFTADVSFRVIFPGFAKCPVAGVDQFA